MGVRGAAHRGAIHVWPVHNHVCEIQSQPMLKLTSSTRLCHPDLKSARNRLKVSAYVSHVRFDSNNFPKPAFSLP